MTLSLCGPTVRRATVGAKAWIQQNKADNSGTLPAPVITIDLNQLSHVDNIRHVCATGQRIQIT